MNLSNLQATLTRNKGPLAAAGALVVVVLALRARTNGKIAAAGTTTPTATAAGVSATPYAYSAGGQTSGASGYDSSASDVYNAIQPQLEQLQQLYSQIPVPGTPTSVPTTSPTPTPAPTPAPTVQGYYRRTGTQAVYKAMSDGTLQWVDRAQYDAAKDPAYKDIARTDPLWNRPVTGTDAPAQFR